LYLAFFPSPFALFSYFRVHLSNQSKSRDNIYNTGIVNAMLQKYGLLTALHYVVM